MSLAAALAEFESHFMFVGDGEPRSHCPTGEPYIVVHVGFKTGTKSSAPSEDALVEEWFTKAKGHAFGKGRNLWWRCRPEISTKSPRGRGRHSKALQMYGRFCVTDSVPREMREAAQ